MWIPLARWAGGGQRDLRLLLTGRTVSLVGSWLLVVAVPYQVFRITGSTLATSLTLLLQAAPPLLVGPVAGAVADRIDRRTILVAADLGAAAGVALMLFATTPQRLPLLYLGLFVESAATCFFTPAITAVLPIVAGTGPGLVRANAALAFVGGAVRLGGPPAGTVLLSAFGPTAVVAIDLASYLVSAALSAALRRAPTGPPASGRRLSGDLREGVRLVARSRLLRGMLGTALVFGTANAALTALLVPLVAVRLGNPGSDVGYLLGGLGVGYLAGAAISRRIVARYPTRTVLAVCYLAIGAGYLVMVDAPTLLVATIGTALAGAPGATMLVATQHRLQVETPNAVLGRARAAFSAADALGLVAGSLVAPAAVALTGLPVALNLFALATVATAVAVRILMPEPVRRLRRGGS
ncbi:MFS transporter [Actinocatenispora sera]|nr:MFS transporter [Actinocatenispora sera]